MRLALTHPYSWPEVRRGAERILAETSVALGDRGHDITVLTSGASPGRSEAGGIRTVRLRRWFSDAMRHERSFAVRLVPYLLSGRFDAVHTMMPYDALAAIRGRHLGRYRVVYQEIGIPWRWWWSQLPDGRARERVVAKADVYGCMSQFALGALRSEWGRDGVLIPGGVRLSEFTPAIEREPVPTILFSGALNEPRKSLAELLRAAALVLERGQALQIWLSGPGDPERLLAHATPRVRNVVSVLPIGTPDEQGERYARAWVTALPSRSDTFGLVLIESLAAGTPIVVLDDSAPPELVVGGNGAISPSLEPEDLANALQQGLNLAATPGIAERCRSSVQKYDWDGAIAPLLESVYLHGRAPSPACAPTHT